MQDLDDEDEIPYRQATVEEVFAEQRREDVERKRRDRAHRKKLRALGFEDEAEVLLG
jgi:U6 snRNA-associated Sm-like protein LSm1